MSKTYTLVLNTNVGENRNVTGGIGAYKYFVNWGSFLPREHNKFRVSFTFRSDTILEDPLLAIQIGVSLGSTYCYSQAGSQFSYVGSILPKSYASDVANQPTYFYEAHERDNCRIMVNYPTNDYITVNITDFNNTQISDSLMVDYVMQINFEVIE